MACVQMRSGGSATAVAPGTCLRCHRRLGAHSGLSECSRPQAACAPKVRLIENAAGSGSAAPGMQSDTARITRCVSHSSAAAMGVRGPGRRSSPSPRRRHAARAAPRLRPGPPPPSSPSAQPAVHQRALRVSPDAVHREARLGDVAATCDPGIRAAPSTNEPAPPVRRPLAIAFTGRICPQLESTTPICQ